MPGAGGVARPQPFTRGNADTHPRYSPDGNTLAFLRPGADGPDSPRQVWTMPAHGGEAARLTNMATGVREFAWSPDSSRLVVVADCCPDDGAPSDATRPDEPKVREVHRIRYRHDAIGWRGDGHFHLFTADAPPAQQPSSPMAIGTTWPRPGLRMAAGSPSYPVVPMRGTLLQPTRSTSSTCQPTLRTMLKCQRPYCGRRD